jgi:Ca2+-binding EF-hand superfamily protein
MSTRSLLVFSSLPVLLAGAALTAYAQTKGPTLEQPVAAKDRAVIEAAFTKADINNDGKLTREESARLPAVATKFDDLDKNKDGVLTLEEFAGIYTATN